jgi:hypothetical protein
MPDSIEHARARERTDAKQAALFGPIPDEVYEAAIQAVHYRNCGLHDCQDGPFVYEVVAARTVVDAVWPLAVEHGAAAERRWVCDVIAATVRDRPADLVADGLGRYVSVETVERLCRQVAEGPSRAQVQALTAGAAERLAGPAKEDTREELQARLDALRDKTSNEGER